MNKEEAQRIEAEIESMEIDISDYERQMYRLREKIGILSVAIEQRRSELGQQRVVAFENLLDPNWVKDRADE